MQDGHQSSVDREESSQSSEHNKASWYCHKEACCSAPTASVPTITLVALDQAVQEATRADASKMPITESSSRGILALSKIQQAGGPIYDDANGRWLLTSAYIRICTPLHDIVAWRRFEDSTLWLKIWGRFECFCKFGGGSLNQEQGKHAFTLLACIVLCSERPLEQLERVTVMQQRKFINSNQEIKDCFVSVAESPWGGRDIQWLLIHTTQHMILHFFLVLQCFCWKEAVECLSNRQNCRLDCLQLSMKCWAFSGHKFQHLPQNMPHLGTIG